MDRKEEDKNGILQRFYEFCIVYKRVLEAFSTLDTCERVGIVEDDGMRVKRVMMTNKEETNEEGGGLGEWVSTVSAGAAKKLVIHF